MESTNRQKVLQLTKQGLTPRQIAGALNLSTQGVHYHLKMEEGAYRRSRENRKKREEAAS